MWTNDISPEIKTFDESFVPEADAMCTLYAYRWQIPMKLFGYELAKFAWTAKPQLGDFKYGGRRVFLKCTSGSTVYESGKFWFWQTGALYDSDVSAAAISASLTEDKVALSFGLNGVSSLKGKRVYVNLLNKYTEKFVSKKDMMVGTGEEVVFDFGSNVASDFIVELFVSGWFGKTTIYRASLSALMGQQEPLAGYGFEDDSYPPFDVADSPFAGAVGSDEDEEYKESPFPYGPANKPKDYLMPEEYQPEGELYDNYDAEEGFPEGDAFEDAFEDAPAPVKIATPFAYVEDLSKISGAEAYQHQVSSSSVTVWNRKVANWDISASPSSYAFRMNSAGQVRMIRLNNGRPKTAYPVLFGLFFDADANEYLLVDEKSAKSLKAEVSLKGRKVYLVKQL